MEAPRSEDGLTNHRQHHAAMTQRKPKENKRLIVRQEIGEFCRQKQILFEAGKVPSSQSTEGELTEIGCCTEGTLRH